MRFARTGRPDLVIRAMHGLNVTEMDVSDLAVLPQVPGDLREHAALVVVLALREGRQVIADVAVDQILHRGGGTPLALLVRRILAAIDPLAAAPSPPRVRP